jgi:hypothetical protein
MTRRRIIRWGVMAAVVFAALVVIWFRTPREPVYNGKTLTEWLEQYQRSDLRGQAHREAEEAIRMIGTNGLAMLLQWASAEDSPLKEKIISKIPEMWRERWGSRTADDENWRAFIGLNILGADAKPIVPDLSRLLDARDTNVLHYAAFDLAQMGSAAVGAAPALVQKLANPNMMVRFDAFYAVMRIAPDGAPNGWASYLQTNRQPVSERKP